MNTIAFVETDAKPIAETIKELRASYALKKGFPRPLSQGKLAAALEVDRNTITAWENGANVPLLQRLRLAEFFDVDPSTLGAEMPAHPSGPQAPLWFTQAMEQRAAAEREIIEKLTAIYTAVTRQG